MEPIISGIQQIGVGIPDVHEAFNWYRKHFGVDIPVFEEAAEANLMLPYTGGKAHQRHAILAINLNGGGGMEIWQYTSREPQLPAFNIELGDLGIYICKIKSKDIKKSYHFALEHNMDIIGDVNTDPYGQKHFYVRDPYGNIFQYISSENWYKKNAYHSGGPYGAIIGVSDISKSKAFYAEILGYDHVLYEGEDTYADFKPLTADGNTKGYKTKRCILTHSKKRTGPFSKMLGSSQIELIQVEVRKPRKIFENRFWGDRGFIHLCFDIRGMDAMREKCEAFGSPFTVDSAKAHEEGFDMGEAAGHFSYIEDPDGALIEFVETHKIPILKKIGWYLDLKKRDPHKPLPDMILSAMALNRVK